MQNYQNQPSYQQNCQPMTDPNKAGKVSLGIILLIISTILFLLGVLTLLFGIGILFIMMATPFFIAGLVLLVI